MTHDIICEFCRKRPIGYILLLLGILSNMLAVGIVYNKYGISDPHVSARFVAYPGGERGGVSLFCPVEVGRVGVPNPSWSRGGRVPNVVGDTSLASPWTDKLTENITFPSTTYAGGKNYITVSLKL